MELEGATDQLQELPDQYASQMARQAELEEPGFTGEDTSAYSKYDADTDTTIEHEGSTSHMLKDQVRQSDVNFNADGTPKQPHGKLTDRMNKPAPVDLKKVPGTLIHLRPGVRAEHVTEDMRETPSSLHAFAVSLGTTPSLRLALPNSTLPTQLRLLQTAIVKRQKP